MSSLKHILETFKHLNTNLKTFFLFSQEGREYTAGQFYRYTCISCVSIFVAIAIHRLFSFLFLVPFSSSKAFFSGALWRRGGKRRESLQPRLRNLNICIEKVDTKCRLADMTLVMTSLPLALVFQCLFTFTLVSATH